MKNVVNEPESTPGGDPPIDLWPAYRKKIFEE